jgi:hypothetical protein
MNLTQGFPERDAIFCLHPDHIAVRRFLSRLGRR